MAALYHHWLYQVSCIVRLERQRMDPQVRQGWTPSRVSAVMPYAYFIEETLPLCLSFMAFNSFLLGLCLLRAVRAVQVRGEAMIFLVFVFLSTFPRIQHQRLIPA
jgi:hypothetical protein